MTEPTTRDIFDAIQQFGQVYHELHQSVDKLRDALEAHDKASSRDRAGLHEGQNSIQRAMDRRFDAFGLELDNHEQRIQALESFQIKAATLLQDADARLKELEAERLERLTAMVERLANEAQDA